jgi:hypothetical protein
MARQPTASNLNIGSFRQNEVNLLQRSEPSSAALRSVNIKSGVGFRCLSLIFFFFHIPQIDRLRLARLPLVSNRKRDRSSDYSLLLPSRQMLRQLYSLPEPESRNHRSRSRPTRLFRRECLWRPGRPEQSQHGHQKSGSEEQP